MSELQPFTLRIFVVDGDPDGLRVVERSNWTGKALVFPRSLLPKIKTREEFQQTGVYMLIGPREDGEGEMIYVGEGDPVRARLESHYAQKEFWTRAVFIVAGPGHLNKAHVQFLECRLINRAKSANRMPLDNANNPTEPTLSEADRADMTVFLGNILGILPVLGINAFEPSSSAAPTNTHRELRCSGKNVEARGFESTQGFIVKAGSEAVKEPVPSMELYVKGMYDIRQDLIARSVLQLQNDKYVFSQDYAFSSPSTAAAVVLGRSANGRTDWKDSQGRTLKTLQEFEAGL